jgi:outer membrane protein assembly factor BamB
MKHKTLLFLLVLTLLASLLSACVGGASSAASSWPGMSADEETIYLAYSSYIYAINKGNGLERWRYPQKAEAKKEFYAAPVLTPDGQLIAVSYNHSLYSLDPASGQEKWVFEGSTDRYIASPLVTEKGIFAPSADGKLYALDFNGQELWQTSEKIGAIWATPATDENCNCLFIASMDHHIYAVDALTGKPEWQSEDLGGSIVGTPAYDAEQKMLYIGTFGSEMVALDAETHTIRWRTPTENWVWSGPAILDGVLYFGDQSGYFYALNATDGSQRWRVQPQPDSPIVSMPVLSGEKAYFTTEAAMVYAIDKDGNITWTQNIPAKLYTAPLLIDNVVVIAEVEGQELLVALNENGRQWIYVPAK